MTTNEIHFNILYPTLFLLILSRYKNFQWQGGTTFYTDFLSLPLAINVIWTFLSRNSFVFNMWFRFDKLMIILTKIDWNLVLFLFGIFAKNFDFFWELSQIITNRVIFDPRRVGDDDQVRLTNLRLRITCHRWNHWRQGIPTREDLVVAWFVVIRVVRVWAE